MHLSRNLCRLIHFKPSLMDYCLGQSFLRKVFVSPYPSRLFSFKVPFYLENTSNKSYSSKDESPDRHVNQWLAMKSFQVQTIDDFKPYLKTKEEIRKMEWILREYENVKYDTSICPSFIPYNRIKELMELPEKEDKLHTYFHFLYNLENRKNARKLRRSENRSPTAKALRDAHDQNVKLEMGIHFDPESGKPFYGKWRNSCFIDLGRKEEYTAFIPRNIAAALFGQKLVIDFSYEDCMSTQEKKSLLKQLCFAHQLIRESEEPFYTWFCNLDPKAITYSMFEKVFGWDHQAKFTSHFINRTPKSYLDLFPRDNFIYLCPDASQDLTTFDHDATYIIGGLVDRSVIKPVSLAKCKKEKIKNLRLPLDQHLSMIGSKILTIDQVVSIMVNLKHGKSMEEALKASVPERKLKTQEQIDYERSRRLRRLNSQKRYEQNLFYQ